MIQRQDIVPPWIEKQQELVKAARVFRARLRSDWKRHAARTISSRGGSLEERMAQADRYAEVERIYNPRKRPIEQISVPTNLVEDFSMVKIAPNMQELASSTAAKPVPEALPEAATPDFSRPGPQDLPSPLTSPPAPFRLPAWEAAEMSYLQLSISNLNSLTRSYNLMAPDLAKKPYFSLERELNSCYAEVAPELADAIKERATRPKNNLMETMGQSHGPSHIMERFTTGNAVVHDSKRPLYGLKEFWSDLWSDKRAS